MRTSILTSIIALFGLALSSPVDKAFAARAAPTFHPTLVVNIYTPDGGSVSGDVFVHRVRPSLCPHTYISNLQFSPPPAVSSPKPTLSSPTPSPAATAAKPAVSPSSAAGRSLALPTRSACSCSASADQSPPPTRTPRGRTETSGTGVSVSLMMGLRPLGMDQSQRSRVHQQRLPWALKSSLRVILMRSSGV